MATKVISLNIKPGIQRDGTQFDAPVYVDGKWVRFQRGRPRKIGGYRGIFQNAAGISRGMISSSEDGLNYVYSGYNAGLQNWVTDDDNGVGSGPQNILFGGTIVTFGTLVGGSAYTNGSYTNVLLTGGSGTIATANITIAGGIVTSVSLTFGGVDYVVGDILSATAASIGGTGSGFSITVATISSDFASNNDNLWQMDIGFDSGGSNKQTLVAHPGLNLTNIDNTRDTPVLIGDFPNGNMSKVGVFSATGTMVAGPPSAFTIGSINPIIAIGQTVSGPGLVAGTTVTNVVIGSSTTVVSFSINVAFSGTLTLSFDNNVSVSGGCVMLHPYLFVYGNNGLIKNSSAGNFQDWVSADSNENTVSAGKIVKGMPVRGGTTSPSGIFWSLDSVIRVSYAPQTIGASSIYWRYDIVTSQSSILSSSSVIEYDGIFYWCGVDRFLMYNGVVQELGNTMNTNYFFDNLNYAQRQKVWVSKVPRWGEIWWFYPRGTSTECNDAIIYNVREKVWYDAGQARGAYRSAGTFSEVFRRPIWAGNEENDSANYTLWQHETGTNLVDLSQQTAIQSYFETDSLGWVNGGPNQNDPTGMNNWIRLERVEPDFVQSEDMSLYVTGKGYASDVDVVTGPYTFSPTTLKIDLREQRREMRLRFESNIVNGNYECGLNLLSADVGDVRSTGNP
jgi:hypothetical protein